MMMIDHVVVCFIAWSLVVCLPWTFSLLDPNPLELFPLVPWLLLLVFGSWFRFLLVWSAPILVSVNLALSILYAQTKSHVKSQISLSIYVQYHRSLWVAFFHLAPFSLNFTLSWTAFGSIVSTMALVSCSLSLSSLSWHAPKLPFFYVTSTCAVRIIIGHGVLFWHLVLLAFTSFCILFSTI